MSNIYWPRRPELCNRDDRVCYKLEEKTYRVLLHGKDIGTIRVTGDHAIMLQCDGLTAERIEA